MVNQRARRCADLPIDLYSMDLPMKTTSGGLALKGNVTL